MWQWLRNFGGESHSDERLAARWHRLHAITYGLLIGEYLAAICWHLAAAYRHREAAKKKEKPCDPPRFV